MIIAAALLLVCCAATAMAALSREQWQPRLNAVLGGASVEKAATPTEEPAPLPTNTPAATATIEPTATFTTTPIPTETQPAPTATQPLRQKPSDTPVPTPETTEALEVMLINEDFSQGSLEKWKLSSEDTPVIQTEGATTALVFPSVGSTALFAKAFELKPGSMIEIVMQVEPEEEQGLHVRWIPGAAEPTDFEKGSRIKIDAGNGNMHFGLLRAEGSDELTADIDLVNANMQTFKILVRNDLSIAFLLNDEEVFGPGDRILSPGESSTGFIVFYGKGKLGLFQVSDKAKTGIKR